MFKRLKAYLYIEKIKIFIKNDAFFAFRHLFIVYILQNKPFPLNAILKAREQRLLRKASPRPQSLGQITGAVHEQPLPNACVAPPARCYGPRNTTAHKGVGGINRYNKPTLLTRPAKIFTNELF